MNSFIWLLKPYIWFSSLFLIEKCKYEGYKLTFVFLPLFILFFGMFSASIYLQSQDWIVYSLLIISKFAILVISFVPYLILNDKDSRNAAFIISSLKHKHLQERWIKKIINDSFNSSSKFIFQGLDSIKKIKESKTNIYYSEYEIKRFEVFKKELTLRGLLLEKSTINTLNEKEELRLLRQEINKLKSKENDLLKAICE